MKTIQTHDGRVFAVSAQESQGTAYRKLLRRIARETGASGGWLSYARDHELESFIQGGLISPDAQARYVEGMNKQRNKSFVVASTSAKPTPAPQAKPRITVFGGESLPRASEAMAQAFPEPKAIEAPAPELQPVVEPEPVASDAVAERFDIGDAQVAQFVPRRSTQYMATAVGDEIRWHLQSHTPLIITGPAGSSKTFPVVQECAALGRPMVRVNGNGGATYSQFIGKMQAGGGKTFFQEGVLPWSMRHGVVLVVDESDFIEESVLAMLHPVTEDPASLTITETGARIAPAKGFTIVLTCNSLGDNTGVYTGTRRFNGALLTRCNRLTVAYPSQVEEAAMLVMHGVTSKLAGKLAAMFSDLRSAHLIDASLSQPPSLRQSVRVAQAIAGTGRYAKLKRDACAIIRLALIEGNTEQEAKVISEIVQRHGFDASGENANSK